MDLSVTLGRLRLPNPILVASGTFGYAREMEKIVDLSRLGGIIPKTVTCEPRKGNDPWRTLEVSAGLLNSIGLDNDGLDAFIDHHLPYLAGCGSPTIVSIAGRTEKEFATMAGQLNGHVGKVSAIELNISCPNVTGNMDFGTSPKSCQRVVELVRAETELPILAKLTPNVTSIVDIAAAAQDGGADAVCLINTLTGMAVDWRRQRPLLGNVKGGLSGPAIKPVALRCVYDVADKLDIPIIGIGGIASIDDVMEFLVTGASAIQIGTANYYDPQVSMKLIDALPAAIESLGAESVARVVGTLNTERPAADPQRPDCVPAESDA